MLMPSCTDVTPHICLINIMDNLNKIQIMKNVIINISITYFYCHIKKSGSKVVLKMCHNKRVLLKNRKISCKTANVIHLLRCSCGLCYVGKTSRPLKIHISEHRCAIRHRDPKSPVAQHFANSRHSVSTLQYIGIEV